jgi:hypothetical protein
VSSISDPGRPSRGDRKRVQRLIDGAYAAGTLSAAERGLRTQRVDAAHTRGDLAMIARDLGAPTLTDENPERSEADVVAESPQAPSLGSAIDPQLLQSMRVGGAYRGPAGGSTPVTVNLAGLAQTGRRIRLVILIVVVAVLGFCGLGVFALVPAFMEGFNSGISSPDGTPPSVTSASSSGAPTPQPSTAASLHSAAGWKALVSAIEQESGSTSVYDAVVYPTYAAVGLDGGRTITRRLYRDGAWQDSFKVSTPIVGKPVDLRSIDPELIGRLPAETAQRLGVEHPTGSYFIVNAIPTDPKIMVYVQSDGGSQYQAYAVDGTPRAF